MHRLHHTIYKSRWHLLSTFAILIVPFLYLFCFSRWSGLQETKLYFSLGISFFRLIIAYGIAVILAWVCALIFYRGNRATIFLPLFDVLQSFPTFAALPLAVLTFGRNSTTVIVFLVLTIIWPIFFSLISSLKRINRDWYDVMEIADLSKTQYLRHFLIPVTIPGLITGSIIGLGEGWEALIATEMIVNTPSGLGKFFLSVTNEPVLNALGILGLLICIFSFNKLIWLPLLEKSHEAMEES